MTKKLFVKIVLESIDNAKFTGEPPEEAVEALLGALVPKDIERFAQWGHPHEKNTPEECWVDVVAPPPLVLTEKDCQKIMKWLYP